MKKYLAVLVALLCFVSMDSSAQKKEKERYESTENVGDRPIKLNNKNFEKNLEKYAEELDLTSKQIKKIGKIEKKFTKKEKKLARDPEAKKKHLKELQSEKRERMIAILDYDQQRRLETLSKSRKGFLDFFKRD